MVPQVLPGVKSEHSQVWNSPPQPPPKKQAKKYRNNDQNKSIKANQADSTRGTVMFVEDVLSPTGSLPVF